MARSLDAFALRLSSAALAITATVVVASEDPQATIAKLARTGEVSCQPALPFFCGNIHVACSGLTTTRTFAFRLRVAGADGWIESASDIGALYAPGRVEQDPEGAYLILRPRQGGGYIKLLADGSYSFRHYARDAATMSYGRCD
jgi:hypothetical protein